MSSCGWWGRWRGGKPFWAVEERRPVGPMHGLAGRFFVLAFGLWPLAGRGVVVRLFFSPCRGRLTFFVLLYGPGT
ncbi:hypothetical protein ACUXIL_000821 [Ralstonia pickettii]